MAIQPGDDAITVDTDRTEPAAFVELPAAAPNVARLQFYVRQGCSLCVTARRAVAAIAADVGVPMQEIDVDSDPDLRRKYGSEVPVVVVDGTPICVFRVDSKKVTAALTSGPQSRRRWWR